MYGVYEKNPSLFYFKSISGYYSWIPIDAVRFFGRKYDYYQPTVEDETVQEILKNNKVIGGFTL